MSDTEKPYGWMRQGLEKILAGHRQRREQEQQTQEQPAVELFQPDGPVAEELPVDVTVTEEPEPEPDYTDSTVWLETREPILQVIQEGNDAGIEVATGKYRIAHRRRTEEDGDVPFIILPAQPRTLPPPPVVEWPGRDRFRLGDPPLDDTQRKVWTGPGAARWEQQGPRVARPDASGRYHAQRQGVRYDVNTGEPQ